MQARDGEGNRDRQEEREGLGGEAAHTLKKMENLKRKWTLLIISSGHFKSLTISWNSAYVSNAFLSFPETGLTVAAVSASGRPPFSPPPPPKYFKRGNVDLVARPLRLPRPRLQQRECSFLGKEKATAAATAAVFVVVVVVVFCVVARAAAFLGPVAAAAVPTSAAFVGTAVFAAVAVVVSVVVVVNAIFAAAVSVFVVVFVATVVAAVFAAADAGNVDIAALNLSRPRLQ